MTRELQLTLMYSYPEAIQQVIQQFTKKTNIQVDVEILEHLEQSALTNYAIYKSGPDISEVGSTWLSNLVSMQAIRPFENSELKKIGDNKTFVKGNWESGIRNNQSFGIPWRGDVRVINYRTDLFQEAGIEPATAFSSIENLRTTVRKLQKLEGIVPWAINTARDAMLVHFIAPWIWNAGGHFISSDGHQTLFSKPEALSGIKACFETFAPLITPDTQNLPDNVISEMFIQGNAAAVISGHWITDIIYQQNPGLIAKEHFGVAPVPGAKYNGGGDLVIWNHCLYTDEALKLVAFLTKPDIQSQFIRQAGYLPVRTEALDQPPFSTDPNYKVLKESLISGRHLNAAYMWGMVEDQLVTAFHSIWQAIFDNPATDLEELIASRLKPLAARLDKKLSIHF
jgi:multiple sugar transport system substrate-binding protein